jgi:hypothetical protein
MLAGLLAAFPGREAAAQPTPVVIDSATCGRLYFDGANWIHEVDLNITLGDGYRITRVNGTAHIGGASWGVTPQESAFSPIPGGVRAIFVGSEQPPSGAVIDFSATVTAVNFDIPDTDTDNHRFTCVVPQDDANATGTAAANATGTAAANATGTAAAIATETAAAQPAPVEIRGVSCGSFAFIDGIWFQAIDLTVATGVDYDVSTIEGNATSGGIQFYPVSGYDETGPGMYRVSYTFGPNRPATGTEFVYRTSVVVRHATTGAEADDTSEIRCVVPQDDANATGTAAANATGTAAAQPTPVEFKGSACGAFYFDGANWIQEIDLDLAIADGYELFAISGTASLGGVVQGLVYLHEETSPGSYRAFYSLGTDRPATGSLVTYETSVIVRNPSGGVRATETLTCTVPPDVDQTATAAANATGTAAAQQTIDAEATQTAQVTPPTLTQTAQVTPPTRTPTASLAPTEPGATTGIVAVTLLTEDGSDLPDGIVVCLDLDCRELDALASMNAMVAAAPSGTTITFGDVSPGEHLVSVRVDELLVASQAVTVAAGETTAVVIVLPGAASTPKIILNPPGGGSGEPVDPGDGDDGGGDGAGGGSGSGGGGAPVTSLPSTGAGDATTASTWVVLLGGVLLLVLAGGMALRARRR